MILREACVGSFEEAKLAMAKGAHRVELCDNLAEGGTTPSYGTLVMTKKHLTSPAHVMIRPRGGAFVYSRDEIELMKHDIRICKDIGMPGVVFGVLTKDNTLDLLTLAELVSLAKPMDVTFHMAFDSIEDKENALEALISLGFDRILTKGCSTKASDGQAVIQVLVKQANKRIAILAGGGINKDNYQLIVQNTGVSEVHGTKII